MLTSETMPGPTAMTRPPLTVVPANAAPANGLPQGKACRSVLLL